MAATPKPVRKDIKQRVKSIGKLYKEDDAKHFHPQEIKAMKKGDYKAVKKTVKDNPTSKTKKSMAKKYIEKAKNSKALKHLL